MSLIELSERNVFLKIYYFISGTSGTAPQFKGLIGNVSTYKKYTTNKTINYSY